ncbi:ankyrin repeat domain-containing protein [Leptospira idonii]|uniref:Ankyrin repeat domain-containing protein n=1 Tax=Leptospira idonii TaxID=1193500 RepID=A0A4R9LV01_9LEPT|nr:ankyrin repeat domain-containing protein [Leptospira idonii]TGN17911.1 ankyrin repeat domain-containing protein [Leptospira idonii]
MKRRLGVIALVMLSILTKMSCSVFELRCGNCRLGDAYQDDIALALLKAAVDGDAAKVKKLVSEGANPNYLEPGKIPMLIWTICADSFEGYKALLESGADPNLGGTGDGLSEIKGYGEPITLYRYKWHGKTPLISLRKGMSAMVLSSALSNPEYLRLAIKYGGDLNAKKGERGYDRPLLLAASSVQFDNIKILIEAGADINIHDEKFLGNTAPELVIRSYARYDIAIWLLEKGYSYDLYNVGVTAEIRKINPSEQQKNKEKLIDMLIAKGIKFPDPDGRIAKGLKTRQIPESDVMDIVYGRKSIYQYPKRPGMELVDP